MRGSEHDQLWNQIEAEIHLHRHKTVIRACRGRKDPNNKTPAPPPPQPESINEEEDAESKARKRRGIGEPRTVVIHKDKTEGLGISITVRIYSLNQFLANQPTTQCYETDDMYTMEILGRENFHCVHIIYMYFIALGGWLVR